MYIESVILFTGIVLGIYGCVLLGGILHIADKIDGLIDRAEKIDGIGCKIDSLNCSIKVVNMRLNSINVELVNAITLCEDIKSLCSPK